MDHSMSPVNMVNYSHENQLSADVKHSHSMNLVNNNGLLNMKSEESMPIFNQINADGSLSNVENKMQWDSEEIMFNSSNNGNGTLSSVEKKIQWKTEEVEALLNCVEEHLDDFRGRMVHVRVWRQIGAHLNGLFPHITPPHCYNKWKNLRRDVRLALSNPQRVLRNPGILIRAAHLAAQVYPTGPEADHKFLSEVDTLISSNSNRIALIKDEKKVRALNYSQMRKKNTIAPAKGRKKTPSGSVSNYNEETPSPYTNNSSGHFVTSVSPPMPDLNGISNEQMQANLLASFLQQQHQLSPQSSSHRTSTPNSNNDINPMRINQAILLHSANMLQNLSQRTVTPPCNNQAPTSTTHLNSNDNDQRGIHINNRILNLHNANPTALFQFQQQREASPQQAINGHLPTNLSGGNHDHNGPSSSGQHFSLPSDNYDHHHNNNNRVFVNTPSTQSIPGGLSNPSLSPECASVFPQTPLPPQLTRENLRDLVQKFRDDESTRISMVENLITLVHDLRADSQRRLDILNNLMNYAQYGEQSLS